MNQTEKAARLRRIRELIRELRARIGTRDHVTVVDILELLADLAER